MNSLNKKVFFATILLTLVLLSLVGCAKDAEETSEETTEEEAAESAEEYSPVVVDTLTQDFEEMGW